MATYLKTISIKEFLHLYKMNYQDIAKKVALSAQQTRRTEVKISRLLGRELSGLNVVEIGPGQRSPYRHCLAHKNNYVGIDIEPIHAGNLFAGLVDDLKNRGYARAVKTVGRKALGLDRRYEAEMCKQFGTSQVHGDILCMDATQMTFPDNSVDVFVSTSVFEHIPRPDKVMSEVARVLRPGGVAHIITHLYTSDSGIHDTRIFAGQRGDIPYWAHLRPAHSQKVTSNSYLNELRLSDYLSSFNTLWPGCDHEYYSDTSQANTERLAKIRSGGELDKYTDEELLTNALGTVWKKPEVSRASDVVL